MFPFSQSAMCECECHEHEFDDGIPRADSLGNFLPTDDLHTSSDRGEMDDDICDDIDDDICDICAGQESPFGAAAAPSDNTPGLDDDGDDVEYNPHGAPAHPRLAELNQQAWGHAVFVGNGAASDANPPPPSFAREFPFFQVQPQPLPNDDDGANLRYTLNATTEREMSARQFLEMLRVNTNLLNFDESYGVPTDLHLPEFVYHKSAGISEQICVICQCDYEDGDVLLTTPCVHNFHKECVTKWFEKNSACPLCKEEIQHDDSDDNDSDDFDCGSDIDTRRQSPLS